MIPCFPSLFQRCHSVRKKESGLSLEVLFFSQHAMDLMLTMWMFMRFSLLARMLKMN